MMVSNTQRYLWLALASVLLLFVGGRWNVPLAAWIAPIFLLRFFRTSVRPWRDGLLLWFAAALPTIISWHGATSMGRTNPLFEVGVFLVGGLLGLLPYLVDRAYHRRFAASFWLTFVYPVAATAIDFFSSGSPVGTFGAAAYSQRDFVPIMQLAALTGLWGISFVLAWFASLACHFWERGFRLTRALLVAGCLLGLLLGLGLGRTLFAQPARSTQVAGFSLRPNTIITLMNQRQAGDVSGFRRATEQLHVEQLAQIRSLAQRGADIVVLQEGAGFGEADQVQHLLTDAARLAQEEKIYLVLPTFTISDGPAKPENIVRIIDPSGAIVLEHVKYGGSQYEGTRTGDGLLRSVSTPHGKLSAIICWDADFPDIVRQAGQQQVDLLFVPANDWREVKDIHAGMATFRAVENGLSLYRQSGQGVSLATDMYGRTVAHFDSYAQQASTNFDAVQIVTIPLGAVPTLYPLIGDSFGIAMQIALLGLVIALMVVAVRKRMRTTSGEKRMSTVEREGQTQ